MDDVLTVESTSEAETRFPPSAGERTEASFVDQADGDTSAGVSAKTHFQTVSDDDVRESIFKQTDSDVENSHMRYLSIAGLVIALVAGAAFVITRISGPSPEDLIARIESFEDGQSFETKNEIERFLKLYPDRPEAVSMQDRLMAFRVDATLKRLRLRAKLRTEEGPLYEAAFLEAMATRDSDTVEARAQLQNWIDVFQDSTMNEDDEPLRLSEIAAYEIERLERLATANKPVADDPKLAELMQRIENASQLPETERTRLLEGILKLYDGQPWAEPALSRTRELLDE